MPAPKINRIVARKPADAKTAPAKGAAADKEKKEAAPKPPPKAAAVSLIGDDKPKTMRRRTASELANKPFRTLPTISKILEPEPAKPIAPPPAPEPEPSTAAPEAAAD